MHTLYLKPLHHRGKEVVGLYFANETLLTRAVKQINNVKWSKTNVCWYVPCTRHYYNLICIATQQLAVIDNTLLKQYLQQKRGLVTDVSIPLHKSTMGIIQQYPLNEHNLQALIAYRNMLVTMKYSGETIRSYCNSFHHLLRLLGVHIIADFTKERVQSYLLWLINERNYSETGLNTAINAIKFYFEKVLGRDRELYNLPRPRMPKKLPDVLAEEEVIMLFSAIKNVKHRVLMMMGYSAGLRVNELVHIKIGDVDSKRMTIHIRAGKGKKDRFVPLSKIVLSVLREYFKIYRPVVFLFEGQPGKAYSQRSAQEVIRAAKEKAKIGKTGSIHMLRHSFATHLLENGTDIRFIQELMGHNDIKTTMRYTHVAIKAAAKIQSPIDRLNL